LRVANGRVSLSCERSARRSGAEASRGCGRCARNRASPAVSPGSSSPGHLTVTHRARIASEQRDTCLRRAGDLHVRRRFRASTTTPYGAGAASVTRPAKGEILVQIEVPSIRPTDSHAWEVDEHVTSEVALVVVAHPVALDSGAFLSTATNRREKENAVPRSRRLCYPRARSRPCDGLDTVRGSIEWCERGISNPSNHLLNPFRASPPTRRWGTTIAASRTTSTTEKLRG